MAPSLTIKLLKYLPRGTLYEVLHVVEIKSESSNIWHKGLAYREAGKKDGQVYVRHLDRFDDEKWLKIY